MSRTVRLVEANNVKAYYTYLIPIPDDIDTAHTFDIDEWVDKQMEDAEPTEITYGSVTYGGVIESEIIEEG